MWLDLIIFKLIRKFSHNKLKKQIFFQKTITFLLFPQKKNDVSNLFFNVN